MAEEVTVQVDDTQAQSAAYHAEVAAENANLAAASAAGATVAQGQLISAVMEHAREDARESAADADIAAKEAESAAETAVAVNSITAEMYAQMLTRLEAIERSHEEIKSAQVSVPQEAVTQIAPEGEEQTTPAGGEGGETVSRGNQRKAGRRHGRRGRR